MGGATDHLVLGGIGRKLKHRGSILTAIRLRDSRTTVRRPSTPHSSPPPCRFSMRDLAIWRSLTGDLGVGFRKG